MKSQQIQQTEIPYAVRQFVFDRDAWCCQNENCKNLFGKYDNLTIHHIIPRSAFGAGWDPCNLVTLCWTCHESIQRWKKNYDYLCITDPEKLMHLEQASFYDHEYPSNFIKCSHVKTITQPEKEKEVSRQRKDQELKERSTY